MALWLPWRFLPRIAAAVFLASAPAAGEFEYESVVGLGACRDEGLNLCPHAYRRELDDAAAEVLAVLETDAECVTAVHSNELRSGAPPVFATCTLPGVLSFQVFALAVEMRITCTQGHPRCDPAATLAGMQEAYRSFRARAADVTASLSLPSEIAATVRRYAHEEAESIGRTLATLWTPEASSRWIADPLSFSTAALVLCRQLGLSRRVLFWRTNLHRAIAEDYGLGAYTPLLAPIAEFRHSRVEVLTELLGGRPAQGQRFAEIGVHLARVAFALLGTLHGLYYIGVDPFVYDGALTPAESAARQLRDLGLSPEADGAEELKSEVRQGAEAKLALFPGRAELLAIPSVDAAARIPDQSLDGVFIDGDHSYAQVVRDIAAWEPKIRPGGFLSGHDFGNHPDVARAVLEHAAAGNRTVHLAMDWVWYWRL